MRIIVLIAIVLITPSFFFVSSMRGYGSLRSPLEEHLLFVVGQARGVIERRVVSRRHRTAIDGIFYVLQHFRFFLRVVSLPIGKIQNSARGVGSKVRRRNGRIPRRAAAGRMALVTRLPKDRVHLCGATDCGRRSRTSS